MNAQDITSASAAALPPLIRHYSTVTAALLPALCRQIENLFPGDCLKNTGRILLVGSGENYAAALAGRAVFSSLSSYPAEWVEALTPTALRHFIEREKLQLGSAFVIAIDCAGDDGQLPHAVREAQSTGAKVLLLTARADCPAAALCDWLLSLPAAGVPLLPETEHFFVSYLALLLLGRAMGLASGKLCDKKAGELLDEIADHIDTVSQQAEDLCARARQVAESCADAADIDIIASGRDYPAGYLARMLCYRRLGQVVTLEESEDWLHVNMLALDPHRFLTLFFVSGANSSMDRTLRTIAFAKELGRQVVTVTDMDDHDPLALALPASRYSWVTPLSQLIPAALLVEMLRLSRPF